MSIDFSNNYATVHLRSIQNLSPFQKLFVTGGNVVINAGQFEATAEGE